MYVESQGARREGHNEFIASYVGRPDSVGGVSLSGQWSKLFNDCSQAEVAWQMQRGVSLFTANSNLMHLTWKESDSWQKHSRIVYAYSCTKQQCVNFHLHTAGQKLKLFEWICISYTRMTMTYGLPRSKWKFHHSWRGQGTTRGSATRGPLTPSLVVKLPFTPRRPYVIGTFSHEIVCRRRR